MVGVLYRPGRGPRIKLPAGALCKYRTSAFLVVVLVPPMSQAVEVCVTGYMYAHEPSP